MMTYINPGAAAQSTVFAGPCDTTLPEVYQTRLVVKMPRSAKREYTDSELCTVAGMLTKLRQRADVVLHLRQRPDPMAFNRDRTLDAVVDRLLEVL